MPFEQIPDVFAPLGAEPDPAEIGLWSQAPWAEPPPGLMPIPPQHFDEGGGYAPPPEDPPKDDTTKYLTYGAVAAAAVFFAYMISR